MLNIGQYLYFTIQLFMQDTCPEYKIVSGLEDTCVLPCGTNQILFS